MAKAEAERRRREREMFKDFWKLPKSADAPVRVLSDHQIRKHTEWYVDRAYWHYSPAAIAAGELDAELRAILRREVGVDQAEVEFARVLRMAHRE